MIKTHLSLNVRNVELSTRWYAAFFGMEPHKERPGYANFDLDQPALKFALNESTSLLAGGQLNHLGLLVDTADEVLAARDRLIAAGFTIRDEEDVVCCHARQTKFWVIDPDGAEWEVYAILDDLTGETTCCEEKPAACCEPAAACCG